MKNQVLLYVAIAAVCYGGWPLLARGLVFNAGTLSLLVSVGTAIVSLVAIITTGGGMTVGDTHAVYPKQVLIALAAGAINGVGTLAYSKILGMQGIDVSRMITLVIVLMIVTAIIGASLFLGESMTMRKGIGIVFSVVAVALLS